MDDIVEDLRATANDTDAEMAARVSLLLEKAADEIARLRLTDAEREAVEYAAAIMSDTGLNRLSLALSDKAASLRALLERTA
jgi:hypothetical protein